MVLAVLRYAFAPVFFVGFIGAAVVLSRGSDAPRVLGPLLVLAVVVSFVVERVVPYERAYNAPQGDGRRDVMHAVVNEASSAVSILSLPAIAAVFPKTGLWPSEWPLPLQLLLAVTVADAGITLAHFASHRSAFLWRFHAVHHSVQRMYGFNGLMKHPLHQSFELTCASLPLLLLGMPVHVAWLLGFAVAVQLLLQHSNVDVRVGPLVHLWAVGPAHRFHHSNRAGEGDVNFGLFSSVWDYLLGTFRFDPAASPRVGELGVVGRPDYPVRYLAQILEPFRNERADAT
jgi:sterol desaturase/sphingolipid hydroxylase (fatty acid hydroxylase superfamily)